MHLEDTAALTLALWFTLSVINNVQDMVQQNIKNAPASIPLIASLLVIAYCGYRRQSLSTLNLVTIAIIATAGSIWIFGLSS